MKVDILSVFDLFKPINKSISQCPNSFLSSMYLGPKPMGIVIFGITYIAQGKKVSANIDQLINAFTKVEDNVKIVEK
ncbi:hypothetical protein [Mycoplasma hafezii]|uniref:hypothetical protein n=1 Tax=Mycoplasma hafezii TaxID=525886 RepID=UPI003CED2A59